MPYQGLSFLYVEGMAAALFGDNVEAVELVGVEKYLDTAWQNRSCQESKWR